MELTSTVVPTVTVDSESAHESISIQKILRRALLEYDSQKQNRSLRFQWLELQTAQQLVDHLQWASPKLTPINPQKKSEGLISSRSWILSSLT